MIMTALRVSWILRKVSEKYRGGGKRTSKGVFFFCTLNIWLNSLYLDILKLLYMAIV